MPHEPGRCFDADSAEFSVPYANDGGPLIILPRELLPYWQGSDKPSHGWVITTGLADTLGQLAGTDYARACAAGGTMATVSVRSGHGIVLGAEQDVQGVRWLRLAEAPGTMISLPMYAEEETDQVLVTALRRTLEEGWREILPAFQVTSGELLLFHAASAGRGTMPGGIRSSRELATRSPGKSSRACMPWSSAYS